MPAPYDHIYMIIIKGISYNHSYSFEYSSLFGGRIGLSNVPHIYGVKRIALLITLSMPSFLYVFIALLA